MNERVREKRDDKLENIELENELENKDKVNTLTVNEYER